MRQGPSRPEARAELERFANRVQASTQVEVLSESAHRVRWQVADRWGHTRTEALLSGLSLMSARVQWHDAWSLELRQAPSALKFMLVRGDGPRLVVDGGDSLNLSGSSFHVSQIHKPTDLRFDFLATPHTADHQELGLEVQPDRLCELLGSTHLPRALCEVQCPHTAYAAEAFALTPGLSRLFDEITNCDARGRSRHLHLDAKCLELLATLIDTLDEAALPVHLPAHDVERLESTRRLLLAKLNEPPSIDELSRHARMSPTKLKTRFRLWFGSSIYALLRAHRMQEAERLLLTRHYSVTEVALRVGYSNPSKFAAAFRRHFGKPPSGV